MKSYDWQLQYFIRVLCHVSHKIIYPFEEEKTKLPTQTENEGKIFCRA